MQRFSRLDEYVNRFTDALLKDEFRVCALKKLISMNLTSETYRRFEISECSSLLLQAGSCTELCKQLLQKIEKVAQEERGCRKRAREMSRSSEENEEPVGKKMKEGSQFEQYVDELTDAVVDDEKNREFALKKLLSLNLTLDTYRRFEVGTLASVLIEAESSSFDEEEETVCKKERIVPDEEEKLEVPQEAEEIPRRSTRQRVPKKIWEDP
ncbi:hypothetical protein CAEBREN_17524 [Caenorhabditis brenneri]|uniref:Uncharacterized protein n=1 Tax=Caenorhabditis brenneri TaxID=135651 RepID=G0MPF1_CAEBE|nr:hypothetical protein CAEBREN_17524 [Caenorhabditis brenneri]